MSDEVPISIPSHIPKPQPVRVTPPPPTPPVQLQKPQSPPPPIQSQVQPPPQATAPPPSRGFSKARERINAKEVFFRLATFLLLAVSLFLVWWSYNLVLVKRQQEVKDLNAKLTEMSREMDVLQNTWSEDQSAAVTKKYDLANSMLLSGEDNVLEWWKDLVDHATQLNLQLGEPKLQALNSITNQLGIAAAALTVDITPVEGLAVLETPYQRLLRFSQHLSTLDTRCDMPHLTISGGSNSFTKATLLLNLWSFNQEEAKK